MTGLPLPNVARKAVGMVAVPSSTSKPCSRSNFTYQAADRYSRHAGSWKFQTSVWRSESQAACALIQSKAVCLAGVSAAGPQSRVAAEWSCGIRGSHGTWRKRKGYGRPRAWAGLGAVRMKSADDEGAPALHDLIHVVRPPLGIEVDELALDVGRSGQKLQPFRRQITSRLVVDEAIRDQRGEPRLRHGHGYEGRELLRVLGVGGALDDGPAVVAQQLILPDDLDRRLVRLDRCDAAVPGGRHHHLVVVQELRGDRAGVPPFRHI